MLTQRQTERFWEDGFLVVPGLLAADRVGALKQRAERISRGEVEHVEAHRLQVEPAVSKGEVTAVDHASSLRKMSHVAFVDDVFRAHAMNALILDCIESLLGPDLKL